MSPVRRVDSAVRDKQHPVVSAEVHHGKALGGGVNGYDNFLLLTWWLPETTLKPWENVATQVNTLKADLAPEVMDGAEGVASLVGMFRFMLNRNTRCAMRTIMCLSIAL